MVQSTDKTCATCKGFVSFGNLCDNLRHVQEIDPQANYVPTSPEDSCSEWQFNPILEDISMGSQPTYLRPEPEGAVWSFEHEGSATGEDDTPRPDCRKDAKEPSEA